VQKEQEETMKTVVVSSDRFTVTQDMLEMDEHTTQRPVKDVEHMELVMEKIPTKSLYGLQASVMQEVQSRARVDATNLAIDHEVKEILQVTCEKSRWKRRKRSNTQQFGEESHRGIQEYTRLRTGTGGYNRSEDTTNCTDHGEIQARNSGVNREFNSEHTSRSVREEGTRGYCTRREYSTGG
jgi:hypothetical protein